MYILSKHASTCIEASHTNNVILPHEENHGITMRRLKQILIPITQILQCRSLKHKVHETPMKDASHPTVLLPSFCMLGRWQFLAMGSWRIVIKDTFTCLQRLLHVMLQVHSCMKESVNVAIQSAGRLVRP